MSDMYGKMYKLLLHTNPKTLLRWLVLLSGASRRSGFRAVCDPEESKRSQLHSHPVIEDQKQGKRSPTASVKLKRTCKADLLLLGAGVKLAVWKTRSAAFRLKRATLL